MKGIIYRAYMQNGMSYIGQTVKSLERRATAHWYQRKKNDVFHIALRYYGRDTFRWEILEDDIDENELNEREKYWIEYYDSFINGFNSDTGGGMSNELRNTMTGKIVSDKVRVIHSECNKGNQHVKGKHWKLSEETKVKMRKPKLNTANYFGNKNAATPRSDETKKRMSESHIGKHWKLIDGIRTYY